MLFSGCSQDIHNQEKDHGYDRIRKPPQTASLYSGTTYGVKASENARVSPEVMLIRIFSYIFYKSLSYLLSFNTISGSLYADIGEQAEKSQEHVYKVEKVVLL